MMDFFFADFSVAQIVILILSAVLIGINKTGLPGLGLLPVVMLVFAFETKISTGLQLMMLCTADLAAVAYYRRHANWRIIGRLIPAALAGIALGSLLIRHLNDSSLMHTIAAVILILSGISIFREMFWKDSTRIPTHWSFAVATGLLAGFSTQVANAAGPVMALYLLSMRLDKNEYMGTGAWYFLILNWLKLPLFAWEGRITLPAVRADLAMLPFLAIGAYLGIVILYKLPRKAFEWIIMILSAAAAVYMLIK